MKRKYLSVSLSKLFISLFLVICLTNNVFADTSSINSSNVINPYKDKKEPFALKYYHMDVCGDSYAGRFYEFESNKDLWYRDFFFSGSTVPQNYGIMRDCMNSDYRLVIVSMGVNDHFYKVKPKVFEAYIKYLISLAAEKEKYIFMHTYMPYFYDKIDTYEYPIKAYDEIIKKICSEYDRAYYIDLNDLNPLDYIDSDNLHYTKPFYDILYDRMLEILKTIDF